MHLIGKDIAWALPPRTGTKTALVSMYNSKYIVSKYSDPGNKWKWHFVDKTVIGDRKVYMNVRSPYTRVQSNWRYYFGNLVPTDVQFAYGDITLEDYIMQMDKIKLNRTIWAPIQLTYYLRWMGIEASEINELIRQETLNADLKRLGFKVPPRFPERELKKKEKDGMQWYYERPHCIDMINRVFHDDFKNFGYKMIKV